MIYITHIRKAGGTGHEHITDVKWYNSTDKGSGDMTRSRTVDWLGVAGNRAFVTDGKSTVEVGVVAAHPPYIRTHADGKWTDNLLALPRF